VIRSDKPFQRWRTRSLLIDMFPDRLERGGWSNLTTAARCRLERTRRSRRVARSLLARWATVMGRRIGGARSGCREKAREANP